MWGGAAPAPALPLSAPTVPPLLLAPPPFQRRRRRRHKGRRRRRRSSRHHGRRRRPVFGQRRLRFDTAVFHHPPPPSFATADAGPQRDRPRGDAASSRRRRSLACNFAHASMFWNRHSNAASAAFSRLMLPRKHGGTHSCVSSIRCTFCPDTTAYCITVPSSSSKLAGSPSSSTIPTICVSSAKAFARHLAPLRSLR